MEIVVPLCHMFVYNHNLILLPILYLFEIFIFMTIYPILNVMLSGELNRNRQPCQSTNSSPMYCELDCSTFIHLITRDGEDTYPPHCGGGFPPHYLHCEVNCSNLGAGSSCICESRYELLKPLCVLLFVSFVWFWDGWIYGRKERRRALVRNASPMSEEGED